MRRFSRAYHELKVWRDYEISLGNMIKARKVHEMSKKYKYVY